MKLSLRKSRGITLLETVVGLGILTMGISAVVGAFIFAYTVYGKSTIKIAASALAREGVEVVRNVRDRYWLPPYTPELCTEIGPDEYCYKQGNTSSELWYEPITSNCATGCQADFEPTAASWTLRGTADYSLYKQSSSIYNSTPNGSPVFYRKIRVTLNTAAPYSVTHPELVVLSTVAWVGRGCGSFANNDPDNATTACKARVEDRLTNWKNF